MPGNTMVLMLDSTTRGAPARKKRYHAKTREGCITCRQRRVKCTEERPFCLRCQIAKRVCAGYRSTPDEQTLKSTAGTKQPEIARSYVPTAVYPDYGPLDERRSLDFYLRRTGPMMSMSGPMKELWTIILPQASWRYPEVKNMLLSLSLLDQYLASSLPTLKLEAKLRPAFEHYNKAINGLLRKRGSLACILLVSVLAYVFDSMTDQRQSAMVHMKATKTLVSGAPPNEDLQASTAEDSCAIDVVREALKAAGYMYTDPGNVNDKFVPWFSDLQMAQLKLLEIVQQVRKSRTPTAKSVHHAFDSLAGWRKAIVRYKNIGSEPLKDKRATVFASGLVGTYLHVIDPEQSLQERFASGFFVRILDDIEHVIEHENPQILGWVVRLVLEEIELFVRDIPDLRERARGLLRRTETKIQEIRLKVPLEAFNSKTDSMSQSGDRSHKSC